MSRFWWNLQMLGIAGNGVFAALGTAGAMHNAFSAAACLFAAALLSETRS